MKLEVGTTLWLVPQRGHGVPREIRISVMGRRWAHVEGRNGWKIDMTAPRAPDRLYVVTSSGDFTIGPVYSSQEQYEQEKRLDMAFDKFKDKVRNMYTPPPLEKLLAAALLLDIEVE